MNLHRCEKCQRLFNYKFDDICVICKNPDPVLNPCAYCGQEANTKDHLIPKSLGGSRTIPACFRCNNAKDNMYLADFLKCFTDKNPNIKQRKIILRFSENERSIIIENINKLIDLEIDIIGS